ncbi:sensor histidine kinase KdpD [Enterorhabdus sp. P55]|uniref:sensor histidine kinase n=1 Tax=Enterorhabdus sp. P55 TaxID=2304571 RepID=UPI0013702389|nr:HAMP domain-containing sensor histidine kinase [Enterorhabdus sp. P55]NBI32673.1 sensor histidine kinase [Enterorhabdus sp. P55]
MIGLALALAGLATCGFAVVVAYGRELRRMAAFLRTRGVRSNARMTTEIPGRSFAELARAVNAELDRADEERRVAAMAQRDFQRDLASLSHDIRTPLMGARGYVQLAADEPDAARRAHYLDAATARLGAMESLLDQLFAYARANDPDAEFDLRPVKPHQVLAGVLVGHFPTFEERGWEPVVDFEDEGVLLEADEEALARIFDNLVANALRYGSGAPTIRQRGRSLTFSNAVADPDAIDADRLFERFYQADAARAGGGSGLGLAVVASLARSMALRATAAIRGTNLLITLTW